VQSKNKEASKHEIDQAQKEEQGQKRKKLGLIGKKARSSGPKVARQKKIRKAGQ
jgi:hypothetical protein